MFDWLQENISNNKSVAGEKELNEGIEFYKNRLYYDAKASFILAKDKGNIEAYHNLAKVYYKLNNLEKNRYYLEKGVEKGDAKSFYYLGKIYHKGIGVKKDKERAEYFYKKAIKKGIIEAIEAIYQLYHKDREKLTSIIKWYIREAFLHRDGKMMYNAWLFVKDNSFNVAKNQQLSFKCFEKATDYGYKFNKKENLEMAKEYINTKNIKYMKKGLEILNNFQISNKYINDIYPKYNFNIKNEFSEIPEEYQIEHEVYILREKYRQFS